MAYPHKSVTVDANGTIVPSAAVEVRDGAGVIATIYDATGGALTNPFASDAAGEFEFYAEAGTYFVVSGTDPSDFSETVVLGQAGSFALVSEMIADTSMRYAPSADYQTPIIAGEFLKAGGYRYQVSTSVATDHHLITAGGVKLKALPGSDGVCDIRQFGATGLLADDQDAAAQAAQDSELPIYIPADFTLKYSTPLVLRAPWRGNATGQGNPGSVTDNNTAFERSELYFTGTGWAVTTRSTFQHICIRSDGVTVGQNGVKLVGAAIGQVVGPVRVLEFDGKGFEVGDSVSENGIFFANISGLSAINEDRVGTLGIDIIGGGASSSNANTFTGAFVSGPWETCMTVQGNNNTFLNADVNPRPADVAALGGTYAGGLVVSGDGNTFINPYFEPKPGETLPDGGLVQFESTASGNEVVRLYVPSGGGQAFNLFSDLGTANSVTIAQIGENFTPSIGSPLSGDNLIPNSAFISPDATTIPDGWVQGGGTTGTISVDTSVTRGRGRTLKFSTSDTRAQAICFLLSASNITTRNALYYYPAEMMAGQTVAVGVWCLSSNTGVGAVSVTNGVATLGKASHSGSGEWEFLTVRTRATETPTEVAIALRNDTDFSNTTGDCWFSEPVFVIGNEVPRFGGARKLDADHAVLTGSMSWNKPKTFGDGDTTPSVVDGSLFYASNTAPTNISAFDDSRDGQEVNILATNGNTSVQNTGSIQTITGAITALSANRVYRFVKFGAKFYQVG